MISHSSFLKMFRGCRWLRTCGQVNLTVWIENWTVFIGTGFIFRNFQSIYYVRLIHINFCIIEKVFLLKRYIKNWSERIVRNRSNFPPIRRSEPTRWRRRLRRNSIIIEEVVRPSGGAHHGGGGVPASGPSLCQWVSAHADAPACRRAHVSPHHLEWDARLVD